MYLILSTPSLPYADAISRELWLLERPMAIRDSETSQNLCKTYLHQDKTKVCVGPLEGTHPIHKDADEFALADLIAPAITDDEEAYIVQSIGDAKGGSLSISEMIESIDSLSPNLRTREQLQAAGWFPVSDD